MTDVRGDGTVYRQKGSRFWWIQYYSAGQRFSESTKTDNEKEARKILRRKLAAVESGEISSGSKHSLRTLYEALERHYSVNHLKDIANLKSRWSCHLEPFFAEKLVSEVNADSIALYVSRRQQENASNGTINREIALVKRMYKLAVKTGSLKVGQQPYIAMLKERNVRKGFLKDEQYQALARETGKIGLWLRAMFEVAYCYGWRKSELLNLKVAQIDVAQRTIMLNPGETKNDQGRTVPMTDRVLELMTACIEAKGPDDYVFTREKDSLGRSIKTPYICDFREEWAKATDAAGCPGLLFHDLRRTGVRNMRRAGISEKVAMQISGHKTHSVFSRYNIVDQNDMLDAARRIETVTKQTMATDHEPVAIRPN